MSGASYFHGAAAQELISQVKHNAEYKGLMKEYYALERDANALVEKNKTLIKKNQQLLSELDIERSLVGALANIPMDFLEELDRDYPGTDVLRVLSGRDNKFIREEYRKKYKELDEQNTILALENKALSYEVIDKRCLEHCKQIFRDRAVLRNNNRAENRK